MKSKKKKWCFALLTAVVTLALLEGGGRLFYFFWQGHLGPPTRHELPEIYQPHPKTISTLKPGAHAQQGPVHIAINSLGFRGATPLSKTKPPGVKRVVCLGGSTTFSMYQTQGQTYPEWLAKNLGEGIEVINAGVPGFSTVESRIRFEEQVQDLQPDWVVIYHGINDLRPLAYAEFDGTYGPYRKHHLKLVSHQQTPWWQKAGRVSIWHDLLSGTKGHARAQGPDVRLNEIPPQRFDAFEHNLLALVQSAKAAGAKVVLISFCALPQAQGGGDSRFSRALLDLVMPGLTLHGIYIGLNHVNQRIETVAKKTQSLYLPAHKEFALNPAQFKSLVHFSDSGAKNWATLVADFLRPHLK